MNLASEPWGSEIYYSVTSHTKESYNTNIGDDLSSK